MPGVGIAVEAAVISCTVGGKITAAARVLLDSSTGCEELSSQELAHILHVAQVKRVQESTCDVRVVGAEIGGEREGTGGPVANLLHPHAVVVGVDTDACYSDVQAADCMDFFIRTVQWLGVGREGFDDLSASNIICPGGTNGVCCPVQFD